MFEKGGKRCSFSTSGFNNLSGAFGEVLSSHSDESNLGFQQNPPVFLFIKTVMELLRCHGGSF